MSSDVIPHGTTRGYRTYGCACDLCRAAKTRAQKEYELDRLRGKPRPNDLVDAEPVRQHVLWLRDDQGMCEMDIRLATNDGKLVGAIGAATIHALLRRNRARVKRHVAERLLAVQPAASFLVPKLATTLRIQALHRLGYTHEQIKDMAGLKYLQHYRNTLWFSRPSVQAVVNVCLAVGDTPGPSEVTRRRAIASGYRPPADYDPDLFYDVKWNGIEPDEAPERDRREDALLEDAAEIERTLPLAESPEQERWNRELVSQRLGVDYAYIQKLRKRRERAEREEQENVA